MNNYLLGQFIREKRESLGMSLREFGRLCDISHTTIDCIEKGYDPRTGKDVNITNHTFLKLSKALAVPVAELVELSQGIEKAPAPEGERTVSEDDIKFALFGDREIGDELFEQVKQFAKFAKEQKRQKSD